jgi:ADP-ribose pyrophosphatase YjhB (NUDIX family)
MIHCSFENGNAASLRHAVVDVIVLRGEQILLVKRSRKLAEGGKWALPGGYMERDETIAGAARRETLEETGWEVDGLELLMINSRPDRPAEDRQNVSFVFVCQGAGKTGEPDWESDEVKWFPLASLPGAGELAFDHADYIARYQHHHRDPGPLPILV